MTQFTFENQGTNTYLVYEISPSDSVDNLSLGMLTNNRIAGLAQTMFTQFDMTKYIKYNVTSRVSARQFLSGPVNRKRLLGVLCGIADGLLSMEEYMIGMESVVLDLDYIFVDVSTCDAVMLCLPIVRMDQEIQDLAGFFKEIIFNVQYDQTEQDTSYVAAIMNYLNSAPQVALLEFKHILDGLRQEQMVQTVSAQTVPVSTKQTIPVQPIPEQQIQSVVEPVLEKPVQSASAPSFISPPFNTQPPVNPAFSAQLPVQKEAKKNTKKNVKPQPGIAIPGASGEMAIPGASAGMAIPGTASGMAIPGKTMEKQTHPVSSVKGSAQGETDGKKISMFYLLQHYNKENAALYKEQKEAKKAAKERAVNPQMIPQPQYPSQPGRNQQIPGQFVPQPGQPMPQSQPTQQSQMFQQSQLGQQPQAGAQPQSAVQGTGYPGAQIAQGNSSGGNSAPVFQTEKNSVSAPASQAGRNPVSAPVSQAAKYPLYQETPGNRSNFGETVVLNAGVMGETTELSQVAATIENKPYLIRLKNNEKINLDKPVFRIGKEKSYVDYFISDNTAISRSHANFITRDGEYFVVDTNSTNHTFLNGQMVQSNVEAKLTHKMKVRLANEEFEFNLY